MIEKTGVEKAADTIRLMAQEWESSLPQDFLSKARRRFLRKKEWWLFRLRVFGAKLGGNVVEFGIDLTEAGLSSTAVEIELMGDAAQLTADSLDKLAKVRELDITLLNVSDWKEWRE